MDNSRLILQGTTYSYRTATGTAFITINHNDAGEIREVFCNVGKAGSDVFSFSEAIGRLISLIFQMPDNMGSGERAHLIIAQLEGIGGDRQSVPDAVAQALEKEYGKLTDAILADSL